MDIIEISASQYKKTVKNPFTIFDTVEFVELNKDKVEAIKYLIFNNGKDRFGLIAGIKNGSLISPFSAPYACFSPISKDSKINSYNEACKALVDYAKKLKIQKITITLPPTIYDENHIAKLYNSLYICGFAIKGCDLNFQYNLDNFNDHYESNLDQKARQKLRSSFKNNLTFKKTSDIDTAYHIIKHNRESKGYPLRMSLEDILKTIKVINADFFLIHDENKNPISAAMVYYITADRVQVIYWGNVAGSDTLKPMNFLSFKLFEFYKNKGVKICDLGPSTEFSIPNFGLCDFKQSIGCDTSSKITFELMI